MEERCGDTKCDKRTPMEPESLSKQAQPLLHMLGVVVAVVVWGYSTFALKENMNDLRQLMLIQKQEMMTYTDVSRHSSDAKFDAILIDIRDQLNYLRTMMKRNRD